MSMITPVTTTILASCPGDEARVQHIQAPLFPVRKRVNPTALRMVAPSNHDPLNLQ